MKTSWVFPTFSTVVAILTIAILRFNEYHALKTNGLNSISQTDGYGKGKVEFNNLKIDVLIPFKKELQEKGLGGITALADSEGMLWQYTQPIKPNFWMKNMKIPLDFIWIYKNKIVDITQNVQPPLDDNNTNLEFYHPGKDITEVIEIAGGNASKYGLNIDDNVKIIIEN